MKKIDSHLSKEATKTLFEDFLTSCILEGNENDGFTEYVYLSKERSKYLSDCLEYAPITKSDKIEFTHKYDVYSLKNANQLLAVYNDLKDNDVIIQKKSSDFFMSLRYYIQFLSSSAFILNCNPDTLEDNSSFFRAFLVNCCVSERGKGEFFKVGAQTNYANKPKKETLFDYDKTLKPSQKIDIYEYRDAVYLLDLLNKLMKNKKFLERDESNNQHYRSRGLMFYIMAISIRDFMTEENNKGTIQQQSTFSINAIIKKIKSTGLLYPDSLVKRFAFSLLTKPFVILSGLAGSGKTQLALAFANSICENPNEQICLVPVGADWTNREPLLGYANALIKDKYVMPDSGALKILLKAARDSNKHTPYFLILDEMNMSYVERYFADFLSAMESGKNIQLWEGNNEDVPHSVCLPKNLFIIGTINVDETTYMFSPKVLDRANVIEFKVAHNDMNSFLDNISEANTNGLKADDSTTGESFVTLASKRGITADNKTKETLMAFFDDLKKVNAEFGYRTAKEIYRFINIATNNDDTPVKMTENDIIDAAIMQKLLPKLHGSRNTLKNVLSSLWKKCFEGETVDLTVADPLMLYSKEDIANILFHDSAEKILRMYNSAVANGFTSFAEA